MTDIISSEFIIEAVTSATNEVFSTMLDLKITSGHTGPAPDSESSSGLVVLIGLAGNWAGTGSLACTGKLACTLAGQFLGSPIEAVNEDVLDAIGEIANMIIGNVKTMLEEKVGPMGLSTPTVIYGRNFQTRSARLHNWTLVPFSVAEEKLLIQLCVAPNEDRAEHTVRHGFPMPHVLTV